MTADCPSLRPPDGCGYGSRVDLYWVPLGAGGRSVRFNGIVYEAVSAALQQRRRDDIYHSVLVIGLPDGRYTVEMTPVPDRYGATRGVIAEGAVGSRLLARLRLFRYEIRRWRDGVVPDLDYAIESPVAVTEDGVMARRVFDLLANVPTPVWGRDELEGGEMWTCNSIISWALTTAGLDTDTIPFPPHARAPGWDAGIAVAQRSPRARRELDGLELGTIGPIDPPSVRATVIA